MQDGLASVGEIGIHGMTTMSGMTGESNCTKTDIENQASLTSQMVVAKNLHLNIS